MPLPPQALELATKQAGLVSAAQLRGLEISAKRIKTLASRGILAPVVRGVYQIPAPTDTSDDKINLRRERLRRRALLGPLAYGPKGVATGLAALAICDVWGVPLNFQPEVTIFDGTPRRAIPGTRLGRFALQNGETRDGIKLVEPWFALAQAVPEVDRVTAVALMDSARNRRSVADVQFAMAQEATRGRRGALAAADWWGLSDKRAESPAETWARLDCLDAGLPPDFLQLEVRNDWGRRLGRVDLAWKLPDGRWLFGEVDGAAYHSGDRQWSRDVVRQNDLLTSKALIRRWTGAQVRAGAAAGSVSQVLKEAGWCPGQAGAVRFAEV
ncbi:MAG: hypothetical protein FWG25_03925 [Promicromonosporaceae bacterium]|nr:hypothetical protein [Promicromonosporaceae bacterium]